MSVRAVFSLPRLRGRVGVGVDARADSRRVFPRALCPHPDPPPLRRGGRFAAALLVCLLANTAQADEWVSLFDGKTLAGWHASAATSHSAASQHKSGGLWRVEDGAISGSQDTPGNGGILVSDASFRDVEVVLEMKVEFGLDSGLFLRSSEAGEAYQAMIDYYPGGTIGGIYGEALSGDINRRSFAFEDDPAHIHAVGDLTPPIAPERWTELWRLDGWNELRARIAGTPPHIETWLNGVPFLSFTDTETRRAEGAIALQVHGGRDTTGHFARFRNIRVRRLD
jgi:Domain of Unknown Function (DUF1080)